VKIVAACAAAVVAAMIAGCGAGASSAGRSPAAATNGAASGRSPAAAASGRPGNTATPPAPRTQPSTPPLPLAGRAIVLDPGHDGGNASHPGIINQPVNVISEQKGCDTVGAETAAGYSEHAFNFDVATRLATLLRREGAQVTLTRHDDSGVGPCVTQRAAIGNRSHADAAISIHADGGPPGGTGFEVIGPGPIPGHTNQIIGPSHRLALDVRSAYQAGTGEPYSDYIGSQGLDVRTDLGGLNLSTVPKVFIECGNMRNASDAARLSAPAFRQRIARALAAGFTAFLTGH
jgi:N-acetylmuramoyl-L-alanine amidase